MQTKFHLVSLTTKVGFCTVLASGFIALCHADDQKSTLAGTWSCMGPGSNGGPDHKVLFNLSVQRDRLLGVLKEWSRLGDPYATAIDDGKIKGNEVSFIIVSLYEGNATNKVTLRYNGKVIGDSIQGTVDINRDGQTTTRHWTAKRDTKRHYT
jgi:hypothetical protein